MDDEIYVLKICSCHVCMYTQYVSRGGGFPRFSPSFHPRSSSLRELVGAGGLLDGDLDLGFVEFLPADADAGAQDVAGDDGPHALGGAGDDDVAALEGHDLRDVAQQAGDLEQHELGGVLLLDVAVDGEVQLDGVRVRDRGLGDEVADGQEGVEPLGDVPRSGCSAPSCRC